VAKRGRASGSSSADDKNQTLPSAKDEAKPVAKRPRSSNMLQSHPFTEVVLPSPPTMPHIMAPVPADPSFRKEDCRLLQEYFHSYNNDIPLFCSSIVEFLCAIEAEEAVALVPLQDPSMTKQTALATVTPNITSSGEDLPTLADMKGMDDQQDKSDEGALDSDSEYASGWSDSVNDTDPETDISSSKSSRDEKIHMHGNCNVSQKVFQFENLLKFVPISEDPTSSRCSTTDESRDSSAADCVSQDSRLSPIDIIAMTDNFGVIALLYCACAMISVFQYKDASIINLFIESARHSLSRALQAGTSPFICRAYAALELLSLIKPIHPSNDKLTFIHSCEWHADRLTVAQKKGEASYTFFLLSLVQSWQEISVKVGQPFQSPVFSRGFQHICINIEQLSERFDQKLAQGTSQIPEESTMVPSKLNILNKPPALLTNSVESCSHSVEGFHRQRALYSIPGAPVAWAHVIENDDAFQGNNPTLEQEQKHAQHAKVTYEDTRKFLTEEEKQDMLLEKAFTLRRKLDISTFLSYANYKFLYWYRRLKATGSICVSPRSPHFQSGKCFVEEKEAVPRSKFSESSQVVADASSRDEKKKIPVHVCNETCDYDDFKNDLALAQMLFEYERYEQKGAFGASIDLMKSACTHPFAYMFLKFSACMHSFCVAMMAEEEHVNAEPVQATKHTLQKSRGEKLREVEKGFFSLASFLAKHANLVCTPQSVYVSITVYQMLENLRLLKPDTPYSSTSIGSHDLCSLRLTILGPMQKIAQMRLTYLPNNIHLCSELCSVQDLNGQMLEVYVSDPAAIVPPDTFSGAINRVYTCNDYLQELSIIDRYKSCVMTDIQSDTGGQFPWDCTTEILKDVHILSRVTEVATRKKNKNAYAANLLSSYDANGGVYESVFPVKRKPGRPRKYPRPQSLLPMVITEHSNMSQIIYPWCA